MINEEVNFKNIQIWALISVFLLNIFLLNQKIITSNDISRLGINKNINEDCIIQDQDFSVLGSIQSENFIITYLDNLDWKNYTSFKCFGEILSVQTNENKDPYFDLSSYEYKERKDFVIQVNYNAFIIFVNIVAHLFTTLFLIYITKTKNEHIYFFLFSIFFVYMIYAFYIKKGFEGYGSTGVNPFELKYDIYIIFILFLFKKQISNQFLITMILVFSLLKPSLLPFMLIILFIKYKFNFKFTPIQNFLFLSIPIIREIVRFISSLSKKYDSIWLSSIQDPISGVQRYPDLWLSLGPLKCQFYENYSTFYYFSDFKMNCPAEFYSPIFKYIKFPFEVWDGIRVTSFLFLVFFILIYLNLLKRFPQQKYVISIFFLSPVINFLYYEGNLDILTFTISFISLGNYKKKFVLKSLLVLLVSLVEIHSILILFGLLFASILNKELKVFFTNLSFLAIFGLIIFTDLGTSSIRSQFFTTSNYDLGSFENVGNQGVGYGVLLDLKQFLIFSNLNQYVLILISMFFLVIVSLFFIKYKKLTLKSGLKNLLGDSYMFYGYIFWFILTTMLANQSYRLANFIPFLLLIFINSNNLTKIFIFLSIFFTPSTQIYGEFFNYLEIFIQRLGLYGIAVYLTALLFLDIFYKLGKKSLQLY